MFVCMRLKVSVDYGQPVDVSVLFQKIEWINMVLRILNVETSMLSVKGQNMASVNMVKDVTKFIFQISDKNDPCEEKYCKKRPPVMCSYFKTYGK